MFGEATVRYRKKVYFVIEGNYGSQNLLVERLRIGEIKG